jgi:hypothetical protein
MIDGRIELELILPRSQIHDAPRLRAKVREYFRAREEFFAAALGASTQEAFQLAMAKISKIERELREAVGI